MVATLEQVTFRGDVLDVVTADDGSVWLSLQCLCDVFGVRFTAQLRKLNSKAWARLSVQNVSDRDAAQYALTFCDLDTFSAWLFSLSAQGLAAKAKNKLALYQAEAARFFREVHLLRISASFRKQLAELNRKCELLAAQTRPPRDRLRIALEAQEATYEMARSFIKECTVQCQSDMLAARVYSAFDSWSARHASKPVGRSVFYKILREIGVNVGPGKGGTTAYGIRVTRQ